MKHQPSNARQKACSACSTLFICGDTESSSCWCNQYPALFDPNADQDCLCKECLHKATIEKIDSYVNSLSTKDALSNNKAKDLPKTKSLILGIDYYIQDGLWVFTAWHHLKRGTCCKNGCRHCPYTNRNK